MEILKVLGTHGLWGAVSILVFALYGIITGQPSIQAEHILGVFAIGAAVSFLFSILIKFFFVLLFIFGALNGPESASAQTENLLPSESGFVENYSQLQVNIIGAFAGVRFARSTIGTNGIDEGVDLKSYLAIADQRNDILGLPTNELSNQIYECHYNNLSSSDLALLSHCTESGIPQSLALAYQQNTSALETDEWYATTIFSNENLARSAVPPASLLYNPRETLELTHDLARLQAVIDNAGQLRELDDWIDVGNHYYHIPVVQSDIFESLSYFYDKMVMIVILSPAVQGQPDRLANIFDSFYRVFGPENALVATEARSSQVRSWLAVLPQFQTEQLIASTSQAPIAIAGEPITSESDTQYQGVVYDWVGSIRVAEQVGFLREQAPEAAILFIPPRIDDQSLVGTEYFALDISNNNDFFLVFSRVYDLITDQEYNYGTADAIYDKFRDVTFAVGNYRGHIEDAFSGTFD